MPMAKLVMNRVKPRREKAGIMAWSNRLMLWKKKGAYFFGRPGGLTRLSVMASAERFQRASVRA